MRLQPWPTIRLALLGAAALLLALPALAGNWPRFRGPNGTGTAADQDVPVKWTADDILWKAAIPGVGHSSPVVWGDRLFLQSSAKDGSERWLICLDSRYGKVRWQKAAPGKTAHTHQRNSLASSTPAVDGERVYTLFWDGAEIQMCAYTHDGELVWKRDLGKWTSQHGPGHSPMLHDGRVFLANDQDGSAVLLALDAKTGDIAWQVKRTPYRSCYSTPCLLERPDGTSELLVASTAGITSYEPASGKVSWSYTWPHIKMPLRTVASPIVADGVVLSNAGDGSGARHLIAVKLGGQGDVTQTHLAWDNAKVFPYVPTMLALGKHVYSVNDKGIAACHVARTGEEVWSERLGSDMSASPVLIGGKIYAIGEDGSVYVFAAATTYKLLAKNSLGERVTSSPAVADNRLYIRGREHLFCIGKPVR